MKYLVGIEPSNICKVCNIEIPETTYKTLEAYWKKYGVGMSIEDLITKSIIDELDKKCVSNDLTEVSDTVFSRSHH